MNRIIIVLFSLGLSFHTVGQKSCDQQKKADSLLLFKFSTDLKKAVMTTDMNKIANFFQFPFRNNSCILDKKNNNDNPDSLISRKVFVSTKYADFFGCWFMEKISKGYISSELDIYEKGQNCKFTFNYPACFPSKRSLCKQHNFCVEKIDGHYLITSSWLSQ
jgi:hypothetical protein